MPKPIEDIARNPEVAALALDVLTAIQDQSRFWVASLTVQDRINEAFNGGVAAAQEAAVKVLREAGFTVEQEDDD